MADFPITDRERAAMLHALGLTRGSKIYRNSYAADPGSDDDVLWQDLTRRRLAVFRTPCVHNGLHLYHVTDKGLVALGVSNG